MHRRRSWSKPTTCSCSLTWWWTTCRRGPEFMLEYWKAHNAHPANCPKPSSTKYKEDYFECTIEMARRAMLLPFPTLEINSNNAISDADQNPGY